AVAGGGGRTLVATEAGVIRASGVRLADGKKGGVATEDGEVETDACVPTEEARTWSPPRAPREGAMFREPHAPSRIAAGVLTFDAVAHPVRALELRGIAPGGI